MSNGDANNEALAARADEVVVLDGAATIVVRRTFTHERLGDEIDPLRRPNVLHEHG